MDFGHSLQRALEYLLLALLVITIPLSFQPSIAGAWFSYFWDQQVKHGIDAYAREVESISFLGQFSVPGAPTIFDHLDNTEPFYLPHLRYDDWPAKLGMVQPFSREFDMDTPIDRLASFDGRLNSCC